MIPERGLEERERRVELPFERARVRPMRESERGREGEEFLNRAIERSLKYRSEIMERLRERLRLPLGTKPVGRRQAQSLIRLAAYGDREAMEALERMAIASGHRDDEGEERCALCLEIDATLGRGEIPPLLDEEAEEEEEL
jgi:hypothetical protein